MKKTMLIVFGGLPGVGKTTLAKGCGARVGMLFIWSLSEFLRALA
jgi:predicted kinase